MAFNQKFNRYRRNTLPTTGLEPGDRYDLNVGGGKFKTFVVSDTLQLIMESGAEFIEKDTMAEFRAISSKEIWAIQNGYYKGVKLNGYYTKGDTPSPIEYYISITLESDDGGAIVEVGGVKFQHLFKSINPLYFGAKGDGVTDDSDVIEKVFRKGIKVSASSDNVFLVTKTISSTSVAVDIDGLTIKMSNISFGTGSNIRFNETAIKTGKIDNSTTINELSRTINLDNTTGLQVGDILTIKCVPQTSGNIVTGRQYVIMATGGNFSSVGAPNNNIGTSFVATANAPDYGSGGSLLVLWDYDPRPGETNVTLGEVVKINAINGNSIVLDIPLMTQYSSTLNVEYTAYRPKPLSINNLTLYSDSTGTFGGLGIANKLNANIQNSTFDKVSGTVGISIGATYNTVVSNIVVKNGYFPGTATGYGIQDNGSTGTLVCNGSVFENNRRGVDLSGSFPSHLGRVTKCYFASTSAIYSDGSGVGTHGGADLSTFDDNVIVGGIISIQLRGGRTIVKNNKFVAPNTCCISISYSSAVEIENNVLEKSKDYSNLNTSYFIQTNSTNTFSKSKPLTVKSNIINEIKIGIIGYLSNDNVFFNGLNLLNNSVSLRSNSSGNNVGYFVNTGTGVVTLRNSVIDGNQVINTNGNYAVGYGFVIDSIYNKGDLGYQFKTSDLEIWAGGGTLSAVSINVTQKTDGILGSIQGQLTFTLTGNSSSIRLINCFRAPTILNDFYSKQGNNMRIDNAGSLYFGYEIGDSYNTRFLDGTYTIDFFIQYPLNDSFKY